ncbi:inorganic pyrophosphatase Ppa [Deltaproteobacteria bacterium TL4]
MSSIKLLGIGQFYEIEIYQGNIKDLEEKAITFSGSLRLHYNPSMVLLITQPLEQDSIIYEFRQEDIMYAKELPSLNRDGVTLEMAKIWVKKGGIAMKMEPFRVGSDKI